MNDVATQILSLIKANPEWAIFVVGLTAFGKSFVFLSLLFPGTAVFIASGTLISDGVLNLLPTVVAGIAGAVLGDSVSYWLGKRFGPRLPEIWPFQRHPERLTGAVSFYADTVGAVSLSGDFRPIARDYPLGS